MFYTKVAAYLDALGISSVNASEADVKAAYRESVLRLHPDRYVGLKRHVSVG